VLANSGPNGGSKLIMWVAALAKGGAQNVQEMEKDTKRKKQSMLAQQFPLSAGSRRCIMRNLATAKLRIALKEVVLSGLLEGAVAEETKSG